MTECRLDAQVIAAFVEASPDFAGELVDLFLQDSQGRITTLVMAAQSGDHDTLRAAAHSLKGSAGTMGARRLAELCHRLEQHAKDTGDREVAAHLVMSIEKELVEVGIAFAEAKLGTAGNDTRGVA
jgi:HPt (histidine-containing phosphotransfer) domain-containing protein